MVENLVENGCSGFCILSRSLCVNMRRTLAQKRHSFVPCPFMESQMGMFDYVKVGVPLPDGWEAPELQSKDFDCEMTTVEITPDGRLRIEDFEYEHVPKAERPHPDADGILGMMGSLRKINRRWRDLDFHGVFNFYGHERIAPPANPPYFEPDEHKWHEYNAKFTDGQLVDISLAP